MDQQLVRQVVQAAGQRHCLPTPASVPASSTPLWQQSDQFTSFKLIRPPSHWPKDMGPHE